MPQQHNRQWMRSCTTFLALLIAAIPVQAQGEKQSYAKSMSGSSGRSYAGTIGTPASHGSSSSAGSNSYASSMSSSGTSYINPGHAGTSYAGAIGTTNSSQRVKLGNSTGGSLLGIMHASPSRQNTNFSAVQSKRPASMIGGSLLNTMRGSSQGRSYTPDIVPTRSAAGGTAAVKSTASQATSAQQSKPVGRAGPSTTVFSQIRKKRADF